MKPTIRIPRTLPTAHTLVGALRLRDQYRYNAANTRGLVYYIVMGDCTEDHQTYYIGTARELRPLVEAGYELLEVTA